MTGGGDPVGDAGVFVGDDEAEGAVRLEFGLAAERHKLGVSDEDQAQAILLSSEDVIEGVSAFLQKRDPDFKGR